MKVSVYTVCLNESSEVADWLSATSDADYRLVLDTGSTDGTQELLLAGGVELRQAAISPWRFDDAFNTALALIPRKIEIAFRVDMDERPRSGWRGGIETAFTANPNATLLRYPYHWNRSTCFYGDRIHVRHGYRWKGPTHEGLVWRGEGLPIEHWTDDITVDHFQKLKNRPDDLKLLVEAVTEYPNDVRLSRYYARELVGRGFLKEAVIEIRRYQSHGDDHDIAYSYRLLAIAEPHHALQHLKEAARIEANASTDLAIAWYWYEQQDWSQCVSAITACLERICEIGHWTDDVQLRTAYPYDIGSVAAWRSGDTETAKTWVLEAFQRDPGNERIARNLIQIYGSNIPTWVSIFDRNVSQETLRS